MPFFPVRSGGPIFRATRKWTGSWNGRSLGRSGLVAGLLLLLCQRGEAIESKPNPQGAKEEGPVSMVVQADHMLAKNIQNEIDFSGHVHLVKGTLRLNSDSLIVYLKSTGSGKTLMERTKTGGSTQRVETMLATGNVVIHTPKRVAYAGRAVYVEASHLFVLTENPVVIQNGDRMSGERITFFTRLNKSLVQGHSFMLLKSRRGGENGKKGGTKTGPPTKGSSLVH